MPRRCLPDHRLDGLMAYQDDVIHRDQAIQHGLTPEAVRYRLRRGTWRALLPAVYIGQRSEPSRRQLLIAALLYAGPAAAIDGADACRYHGVKAVAVDDDRVHVVEPWGSEARSRGFVVVRRTVAPIRTCGTGVVRYVDAGTAVIAAARRMRTRRAVLAALSDALQRGVVSYEELIRAHVEGPPRNFRHADVALGELSSGVRSAPEADFMRLASSSLVLPPMSYNVWLRVPGGRVLCVDALIASSATVHETNGRSAHRRADLFDDMQERHDVLTAAGFTVLHNSPQRIRSHGREVIVQVERCHEINDGRGLPGGVELLAPPDSPAAMAG